MQGGESAQAWTTQGGNESEGSSQERSDRFDAVAAAAAAAAAIVCVARDDGLRAPVQFSQPLEEVYCNVVVHHF